MTPQEIADKITETVNNLQKGNQSRTDRLEAKLKVLDELRAQQDDLIKQMAHYELGSSRPAASNGADRLAAFNAMLQDRQGPGASQLTRQEFADYQTALAAYVRHGAAALDRGDIRAALSVGSDPSGGYTVLPQIDPQPREKLFRTSPMRAIANQLNITQGDSLVGLYDDGEFASGWVGELSDRSETDLGSLAQFQIFLREVYALCPLTQRLIDMISIDILGYVEAKLGGRFRREENASFVSGNGVLRPRGFLDYAAASTTDADEDRATDKLQYITTGAAGGFPTLSGSAADDPGALYDVKAALHAELREEAVWAMNSTSEARLMKLRDAEGRWLFQQSLVPGTPNTLLGSPIVIMEDMPDFASNAYPIAYGNFRVGYQIIDKPGVRILRDPYTTKGRTKVYAYKYVGGDVVNFSAIKLLKASAS